MGPTIAKADLVVIVRRESQQAVPRATSATPATRATVSPVPVSSGLPRSMSATSDGVAISVAPLAASRTPVMVNQLALLLSWSAKGLGFEAIVSSAMRACVQKHESLSRHARGNA